MSMMNCPAFCGLDRDIVEDFLDCLQENVDAIEDCLSQLDDGNDKELINRLFRDVHSFKGNCRMVFLDPVVEITHSLEEIVEAIRHGERDYHSAYRIFITEIIYRVNNLIRELYDEHEIDSGPKDEMLVLIKNVLEAENEGILAALQNALIVLTGESAPEQFTCDVGESQPQKATKGAPSESSSLSPESDLEFFKKLGSQLDALNIYRADRCKQLVELCLETNKDLGSPVDDAQLEAAVYLHDLGMALVPREVLDKPGKLKPEEFAIIQEHVYAGCQVLKRVPGWEEASRMVEQHHEQFDGSGYPAKLKGEQICAGAKIIALADTYYAMTNQRVDRSYKKSLFSAVSLINGNSGTQFDPVFVEGFNEAVRRLYVGKS